jgi:hypothetical protein
MVAIANSFQSAPGRRTPRELAGYSLFEPLKLFFGESGVVFSLCAKIVACGTDVSQISFHPGV